MDTPPDLASLLTPDTYHHLIHTLWASLPPPTTDVADAVAHRDNAAIAQVASLHPVSAAEATLAAQFVTANAQAMHWLRQAHDPGAASDVAQKCRYQASRMLRHAQGGLQLLLRLQATRQKNASDNAAVDRATWTEHCAAEAAEAPEAIAAAADCARTDPQCAAQISYLGRRPDDLSSEVPTGPEVHGLLAGQTAALRALDRAPTQPGAVQRLGHPVLV